MKRKKPRIQVKKPRPGKAVPAGKGLGAPLAASLLLVALFLLLFETPMERMVQMGRGQTGFQRLPLSFNVEGIGVPWGYAGWITDPTRPRSAAPVLDRNMDGGQLEIDGVSFDRGIGTHAPSQIALSLGGKFRRFSCSVGLDQSSDQSHGLVYSLRADGREIFRSPKLHYGAEPFPIQADVEGVRELVLCADITDVEDVWSGVDWVQLRFEQ